MSDRIEEKYRDKEAGIYLRLMTREDTDKIVAWRNTPEVRNRFLYRALFTRESHLAWVENMVDTGKVVQMIICDLQTDIPLGSVYIRDIDRISRKAEYGIFLGEASARGRGIGTAAAKLMLRYCFEEEKLHKVFLRVIADNKQAIRSYEKAGFVQEAYLKDEVFVDGAYLDILLMAVLEPGRNEA